MTSSIPAASLAGVDFDRMQSKHPEYVDEIKRLGSLLTSGDDTEEDFLRLCQLLLAADERSKAMELLLANCTEGDPAHVLFEAEFPDAERQFERAVAAFGKQFGCELSLVRSRRPLSGVYRCSSTPASSSDDTGEIIQNITDSEIEITYEVTGDIVADIDTPSRSIPVRLA